MAFCLLVVQCKTKPERNERIIKSCAASFGKLVTILKNTEDKDHQKYKDNADFFCNCINDKIMKENSQQDIAAMSDEKLDLKIVSVGFGCMESFDP